MNSNNTGYHKESGTARSYVAGFILSIVFTVIPYYLVSQKVIAGTMLLITILSVAVIQMLIQIFFFLHLGRGPKPFYNVVFFVATVGIIIIAVGGSLFIMENLYRNMSPSEVTQRLAQKEGIAQVGGEKTGACQGIKANHIITISDLKVEPAIVEARLCDTLTFINKDNKTYKLSFGMHPQQNSYGGLYEVSVDSVRPESITLNQAGNYTFHDHINPTLSGHFSVR